MSLQVVAPKRAALAEANARLQGANQKLSAIRAKVAELRAKVADLEDNLMKANPVPNVGWSKDSSGLVKDTQSGPVSGA